MASLRRPPRFRSLLPPDATAALALACALIAPSAPAAAQEFRAPLSPSPAKPNACAYGEWSPPEEVPGVPYGVAAMSPSLALAASGGFVVASDIFAADEEPVPARPLVAFTLDGRSLGKPPGAYVFAYPKAVVDSKGTLHVVWGESDARPTRVKEWHRLWGRATSLWYAAFDHARGWTIPREIHRSAQVRWGKGLANMVMGRDGIHLAVSTGDFTQERTVHLVVRPDGVQAREIPNAHPAAYVSLALGDGGQVYVAYVGPAPDRDRDPSQRIRHDSNSLFLARSRDGGRTWTPPMLISLSGRMQGTEVRTLVGKDGSVHLVWGQNLSGGFAAEVLRHTVSYDGGETWSAPEDVDGPDWLYDTLAVAIDGCGAVHAVVQSFEGAGTELEPRAVRGELWYARWNGRWSTFREPFPAFSSLSPDLAAMPDGGVALFWSARPATDLRLLKTFRPMLSRLSHRSVAPPASERIP